MSETAGSFLVELVSVFNGDGFTAAQKSMDKTKTAAGSLTDALDELGKQNPGASRAAQDAATAAQCEAIRREDMAREEYAQSYRGRLFEKFFGTVRTGQQAWDRDSQHSNSERAANNRATLLQMERDWEKSANTIAGGWREAMTIVETKGSDWTSKFLSMTDSATSGATTAIKAFFTKSSDSFMKLETLVTGVFDAILTAFLDMVAQMAAKAAILSVFKAMGLFSGGIFETVVGGLLGSRQTGGSIDQTGPYLLHAGEYVLPSNVVSAIKTSSAQSGTLAAAGAGGGAVNITVSPTVNFSGTASEADARRVAEQITQATKRGVSWAVELAKVTARVAALRSGEAAL